MFAMSSILRAAYRLVPWLVALALLLPATTWSQDVQLAQQRGPYYVDEPMVIQIQVTGVQSHQQIDCRLQQSQFPAGVTVTGPEVGQSKSTFSQIINGQITSRESVSFKYNYQIASDRAGAVSVGPFVVTIDSQSQTLEGVEIEFEELAEDPHMRLELELPQRTLYVGEQVPLTIRWLFDGDRQDLQYAFSKLQIRSPLFDQLTFVEAPITSRLTLSLVTTQGLLEIDAALDQQQRDGREYTAITGKRLLALSQPGKYERLSASCRTQRVLRWGRGMFGDARPLEVAPALARSAPISFEVQPIPTEQRPASFSGAVGQSFTLTVSANRSVVRVGDPISLDILVSGDGDLGRVALPDLSLFLDPTAFELPVELPVGTQDGNTKQFTVTLRVKNPTVQQLPPVEFAWFDPQQAKFATTQSKPIALQVEAAQVIGASQVVAAPGNPPASPAPATGAQTGGGSPSSKTLNFLGANLAIERRVPNLIAPPGLLLVHVWLTPALYTLGIVVLAGSLLVRNSIRRSPQHKQKQAAVSEARRALRTAVRQTPREAVDTLAGALRRLVANCPDADRRLADQVIAQCEQLSYAPQNLDSEGLKSQLIHDAGQAIDRFSGKSSS